MRRRSLSKRAFDQEYRRLKLQWRDLPENHYCSALCRDEGKKTPAEPYPHHIRGRGSLQNDVRFWMAICPSCHTFIENHRKYATERGWLASRDSKTMKLEGLL